MPPWAWLLAPGSWHAWGHPKQGLRGHLWAFFDPTAPKPSNLCSVSSVLLAVSLLQQGKAPAPRWDFAPRGLPASPARHLRTSRRGWVPKRRAPAHDEPDLSPQPGEEGAAATTGAAALPPSPYQLVGDVAVVLPGHALPDGRLHQTGERGQHVDGGVDLWGDRHGPTLPAPLAPKVFPPQAPVHPARIRTPPRRRRREQTWRLWSCRST